MKENYKNCPLEDHCEHKDQCPRCSCYHSYVEGDKEAFYKRVEKYWIKIGQIKK